MTIAEWVALPEDDDGELVDGVLVEEEVTDFAHDLAVSWLIHVLRVWLGVGRGFVAGSDAKYAISDLRGRKPDIAVYLPGTPGPPARGAIRTPPDIMIEVVSPSPRDERRDRVEKLDEYAAFGVRWYWVVDPALRTFEVFERGADGRYVHALGLSTGTAKVDGLTDLAIDVDALWAELDRLAG
jgi:Uma2 family endonuclease